MYLSEKKAAEFLDLAPTTLRIMRCRGVATARRKGDQPGALPPIPYSKFGRTVRYAISDLEAYAAAHRVQVGATG